MIQDMLLRRITTVATQAFLKTIVAQEKIDRLEIYFIVHTSAVVVSMTSRLTHRPLSYARLPYFP